MKLIISIVFLSLVSIFNQSAYAIDFEDGTFPELITSARALAMGNAYINKTDDAWAAFYNPAGLGTVRKSRIHLFNMHLESNKGLMDVVSSGETSEIPQNLLGISEVTTLRALMAQNPGELVHSRINLYPNATFRYFSFGFLISQRTRAWLQDTSSDLEYADRLDYGPVAAFNVSLFGGIVKIGASGALLVRKEYIDSFDQTEIINFSDDDYNKGNMLYTTVGLKVTLPFWGLPAFSAVVRNASDNEWSVDRNVAPTAIERSVDLAFSFTPQIGKASRMHTEINYKDVSNKYQTDESRRITAGLEFDFRRTFFVRMGYGDGYGSFGLGIRSKRIIVDLTSYAVETTNGNNAGSEDRRFALSISSGY